MIFISLARSKAAGSFVADSMYITLLKCKYLKTNRIDYARLDRPLNLLPLLRYITLKRERAAPFRKYSVMLKTLL